MNMSETIFYVKTNESNGMHTFREVEDITNIKLFHKMGVNVEVFNHFASELSKTFLAKWLHGIY